MNKLKKVPYFSKYLWLIFLFIGMIGFFLVWFTFPHHREKYTLIQYMLQIIIFVIFLLSISFFPVNFKNSYILLTVPFILFLGYFCPKMDYLIIQRNNDLYYTIEYTFLYPGLIMALCLAFRLGGGSPGNCIKTGLNGIILIFSGFLDFMWFVINKIDYAHTVISIPHIQVIIGHAPSWTELITFMIIHFIIIIILNLLPLNKWIKFDV